MEEAGVIPLAAAATRTMEPEERPEELPPAVVDEAGVGGEEDEQAVRGFFEKKGVDTHYDNLPSV